jgi:hypothetical protein
MEDFIAILSNVNPIQPIRSHFFKRLFYYYAPIYPCFFQGAFSLKFPHQNHVGISNLPPPLYIPQVSSALFSFINHPSNNSFLSFFLSFFLLSLNSVYLLILGRAMTQAVSHWPLNAEARVRSRASTWKNGTGTGFSPRVLRISPVNFIPPVLHYTEKLIIFITGLHNKPQGCGASVATAAGPFNKYNIYSL